MPTDHDHLASPPIPPENSPENGHSWADDPGPSTDDRLAAAERSRDQFRRLYTAASIRADEQQADNVLLWAKNAEAHREVTAVAEIARDFRRQRDEEHLRAEGYLVELNRAEKILDRVDAATADRRYR